MKIIVVQYPLSNEYGFIESYENDEVWGFPDDVDVSDLQNRWNKCKSKTRFIDYMVASNGILLEFDEMIK